MTKAKGIVLVADGLGEVEFSKNHAENIFIIQAAEKRDDWKIKEGQKWYFDTAKNELVKRTDTKEG